MEQQIFWVVVHEDTHGNRDVSKSGISEAEADDILARFAQNKPHKQEYYKFPYTRETRRDVFTRQGIRE